MLILPSVLQEPSLTSKQSKFVSYEIALPQQSAQKEESLRRPPDGRSSLTGTLGGKTNRSSKIEGRHNLFSRTEEIPHRASTLQNRSTRIVTSVNGNIHPNKSLGDRKFSLEDDEFCPKTDWASSTQIFGTNSSLSPAITSTSVFPGTTSSLISRSSTSLLSKSHDYNKTCYVRSQQTTKIDLERESFL